MNIWNKLTLLLFILLSSPILSNAQDNLSSPPPYEVKRIYPYIALTKEELKEAQTLLDLHARYKSSWVREYLSVEILTRHQGQLKSTVSKNDTLSQQQKDRMQTADLGTGISVNIRYMPENNLKHNEPKEMDFTFVVIPESEAKYADGSQALQQYLKEKAIDKIPSGSLAAKDLAVVKFTVNDNGEIANAHMSQSTKNEQVDHLLLEAVRGMPCWTPATYSNGTTVGQECVLMVGNMESCVINFYTIRRNRIARGE